MKKRLLSELCFNDLGNITDERLNELFDEQTAILHQSDRSDDDDILEHVPHRSRVYAAAWLAGEDLAALGVSRSTLYAHAKVLRECGIDILQRRNLAKFPVRVRTIEIQPLAVPDWYSLEAKAA